MKNLLLFIVVLLMSNHFMKAQENAEFGGVKITFTSLDDLLVTADLYMTENQYAPLIILFHQARYSRGEYRPIAPKLNELGFNCLAVDLRSGKKVNGIVNETHKEAYRLEKGTKYIDALPDMEAALDYAKNELQARKIIVWGSSYSSVLALYLGSKYPDIIDAIVAFSPGEYFEIDDRKFEYYASLLKCPVFISSAKKEHKNWKEIYDRIPADKQFYLPQKNGYHGSRALWAVNKGHQEVWKALEMFLMKIIP